VNSISKSLQKRQSWLRLVQWALPLGLFALSVMYEMLEFSGDHGGFSVNAINGEVIMFGMIGPLAVGVTIAYVRRMIDAQNTAQAQLETMNIQLEKKVAERTATLAQQNTELAHANDQLHKLDEMKSEFVAMVSHELRAPLTIMNGAMEMTLRDDGLTQPTRNTLAIMASESKRLTDFVQTILDLSRLEAGKVQVNLGPVAIRPLMEQAAEMILAHSARPVIWEISSGLPPAWADEVLLDEVLRNLIRNADKYSPPTKPIYLIARQDGERNIYIAARDLGNGVAPEAQERIFDRFERGQNGESAPAGWGLGLYLARKLIEAQHGQIGVRSPINPGAAQPGSEFFVRIPLADMSEEEIFNDEQD